MLMPGSEIERLSRGNRAFKADECSNAQQHDRPSFATKWGRRVLVASIVFTTAASTLSACGETGHSPEVGPARSPVSSTVDSVAPSQATGPVYLALGDSAPLWNGNASYPNYIAAHYRSSIKGLKVVNLSVSGETSGSMLSGSSATSGSQQQQAVSFLETHRSSVVLITIDIGGNDVLTCGSGTNTSDCLQQVEATMASNLTTILTQLRAAAGPSVPIVGMSYYDPYLGDWLADGTARSRATGSVPYLLTLNDLLAKTYGAAGDRIADVQDAFQSSDLSRYVSSPWGQVPVAVERACTLLDMSCRVGQQTLGTDPSPAGAKVIAEAFERVIGVLSSAG